MSSYFNIYISSSNLFHLSVTQTKEADAIAAKIWHSFFVNHDNSKILNHHLTKVRNSLYGKFKSTQEKILSSDLENEAKEEAIKKLKVDYTTQKNLIKKDEALFQLEEEALEIKKEITSLHHKINLTSETLYSNFLNSSKNKNDQLLIKSQNNLKNAHAYYDRIKTLHARIKEIEEETKDLAVKTEAMIKHYSSYETALSASDEILDIALDYYVPPKIVVALDGTPEMNIIDGKTIINIGGFTLSISAGAKVVFSGSSAATAEIMEDAAATFAPDLTGACSGAADYSE